MIHIPVLLQYAFLYIDHPLTDPGSSMYIRMQLKTNDPEAVTLCMETTTWSKAF